ncbi:MAG: MBL fold metallo-hydrolase [Planctomycetota bacterium]
MEYRVLSIGCLSAHPLRGEEVPVRTGHATCSLIRVGSSVIVVDPGLPAEALRQRLDERAGIRPDEITHVFLTSFKAETCRGIGLFENAAWLVHADEREGAGVPLAQLLMRITAEDSRSEQDAELRTSLEAQIQILQRCETAPDTLAADRFGSGQRGGSKVDLFPLPGVTPGTCGLLLAMPKHTILITGDAVATVEHLEQGKILDRVQDVDRAKESFAEAIEIADLIVPGRDNISAVPTKRVF